MSKKDFWDMSWNPVWGCLYNCQYCYARKIAVRYAEQIARKEIEYKFNTKRIHLDERIYNEYLNLSRWLKSFKPTWLESNYVRKFPRKPSIIFVNSMSDPAYWKQSWYEKILKRICENMHHTFIVFTKQPKVYQKYHFPHNTILGVTINNYKDYNRISNEIDITMLNEKNKLLVSIEPIQNTFSIRFLEMLSEKFDWIHVGEESGNRKGRIRATKEMIQPFFDIDNISVFMKNNLNRLFPGQLRKEFPEL